MTDIMSTDHPRWDEFAERLIDCLPGPGFCDHSHRAATQIMAYMGNIDIPASIEFFEERGGYCDCEILLNVDPAARVFALLSDDC
jgi:hypothetical protein